MKKIIFGLVILAVLGACSTAPMGGDYGTPHYISNPEKPSWVDNPEKWQKSHNNRVWAIGVSSSDDDETLARQDAKMNALGQISDGIRDTVHNYFISARTLDQQHQGDYNTETERAIESGTLSVSRAIVTGATVDHYWSRKYWIQSEPGGPKEFFRDEYALVFLSRADYQQTLYQTLNGVQKQVQDPKAQHVIQFMKKHYLNDLNGHE